nr:unnamed protein product [Callosobruchus chinensis]
MLDDFMRPLHLYRVGALSGIGPVSKSQSGKSGSKTDDTGAGILGDAQRVTRGSGDFFDEQNIPTQDQNTLNNDIEDGSNIENIDNEQVLPDDQLGATLNQEAFDGRGNLLSNERVDSAIVQEPGANCGCKRRIVIIPEEIGKDMQHSNCFTVLSDAPVEARMISDQSQDIVEQGPDTEPQFDQKTEVERTHLVHKLIHKKLHNTPQAGFQHVQGPINVHVTQHQNLAVSPRASSSDVDRIEGDPEFPSNQEEPEMEAGITDSPNDNNVGAERFHHVHDLIHKKLLKNQQSTFQNAHQTPVNIHVTQNQQALTITSHGQVDATQPSENQPQVTTAIPQSKNIIGPASEDHTELTTDVQTRTTSRPPLDTKTDAPKEQVGSIFSEALIDKQEGLPLSTPTMMSDKAVDENDEQVGSPLDDIVEKIEAHLSERLGAERTHHIHEILHKNLHRPQAAAHHAQAVAPVNVHIFQNQQAVVAPRMSAADQESENTGPSSNISSAMTTEAGSSTPVNEPGSQNEHVGASTPNDQLENEEKVGASAPNEQLDDEEEVGSPAPTDQSDDEPVGAFLHQNIHRGVFVPKPIVHHGFGLNPTGVIVHNQHSIFGLRSASAEEDGSAATNQLSNNRNIQSQTDGPSETVTTKINTSNNEDQRVTENIAQNEIHSSTPIPIETETKSQLVSTTPMPVPEPQNTEQTTDAKNDEQLGAERTTHLIHKIHNKLHGPPKTTATTIPVNIHIAQNQAAAILPRDSSGQEAVTSKGTGHLSLESNSALPDLEAPSSARHLNHALVHRHDHVHSTGTVLPNISSFLNSLSAGISSSGNVIQNQNANVSPQNPSSITNVNVVQNQNAAVDLQRPTTFIPSSGGSTNVEVFQNQNAAVAPQRPSTFVPLNSGLSTNVEVFQNQNAAVGPQRPTTFIPSISPQMASGFVPVSSFGGASTNFNQEFQSTNIVQNQEAVILPSKSHLGGLSIGTQGYHQGLPSIQKPFGYMNGHTSLFQSQSAAIGRNAEDNNAMEDIDVPDVEMKKGNLVDGDDSNADSNEVVGTYLHPHDPYYDNDNPDKTKVIDLIEDKKRIISKMIDSIKSKHDKILDSLKPKLQVKKHKQYYPKPQYPEEPQYQQYPAYAHDYNDHVPDVSWEYDPSYRASSREESDTSISAETSSSIDIEQEERRTNEDHTNIDSDSLRFVRSTKVNLDNLLKKEEDVVADLKKYVKRDEDLMMIDYVAEKMIDDIDEEHGSKRKKRQIVTDEIEFQRLLTDPNTKLDMTKTLENVGTVARSAIEHQRAPLYHFRNAVGSVRDAVVATMKIPNQNFIIPAQYEIVNQQDAPQLAARFGEENDKCSDDPVTDTFQRVGSVVRSTIKSGQEAIGHIGQAANHARTAIHTTHNATPRLRLAKIPARVQTPKLSSRMGGDETVGEPEPKNFVNLGRIMDAVGISNPDSTVGSESIVFVPRSRLAAMRNRFRAPPAQPPKRSQQDPVVGVTMKNVREAQQAVGAHSLGDLLKRMRDGLQGFVRHDILGMRDDEVQRTQEKKGNKQPVIGSRSSIPTTEIQPKQPKKSTNLRKNSNVTQTKRSEKDDIVGSGLPLSPELLHPFMNRATSDQEKKFLDLFNSNPSNQRSNDEHLGDVLGAINPIMFQRVFQEKLKTENSTDNNTPHDVFHHHHDGHSHGVHEVTDHNDESGNVSTSMKIQGPFLKPFMGQPSKKNKDDFFSQFQRSSDNPSQENPGKSEMDDASAMQSAEGNDLQDVD